MSKIKYDHDSWGDKALKWMHGDVTGLEAVAQANRILDDYSRQGYTLTLRQLYYQFVAQGLTSENTQQAYKNLGKLVTKARNNGLIDWLAIEDRGRGISGLYLYEEDERAVLDGLEYGLNLDLWERQESYVEVWVEKDALSNVMDRACRKWHVPYLATKGYLSASEAWRAGQRFERKRAEGKNVIMIHLGDHDPEGIDMTRDNEERLVKYSQGVATVTRIALTMAQVEEHNPPPNYAKASSSRFNGYVDNYGEECWELDALEPATLVDLIDSEIRKHVDMSIWQQTKDDEKHERRHLAAVYDHWEDIKDFLDPMI